MKALFLLSSLLFFIFSELGWAGTQNLDPLDFQNDLNARVRRDGARAWHGPKNPQDKVAKGGPEVHLISKPTIFPVFADVLGRGL